MTVSTNTKNSTPTAHDGTADVTGRGKLLRNVLASWGAQFVFIVFGFVLPRMIDGSLGRTALGVWDFSWSVVMYFTLVQAGITASVNRFVSRYRALDDPAAINRAVSSVTLVLLAMGVIILGLSIGARFAMPTWFAGRLGDYAGDAGWLVLLLGISLAVQTGLSAFGGVLTGHHRWELHNAILAGGYLLQAVGIIVALLLGAGLPVLGAVVLFGECVSRLMSTTMAHRICPTLRVSPRLATWAEARQMFVFGAQGSLPNIGDLVLYSSTSALIVAHLGPASLALFARPMALIRHARTLVQKFAYVLVPTASSLQAMEREEDLRAFMVSATRYGAFIALPIVAVLCVVGGPLLHVWMGPDYARDAVIGTLAAGHALVLIQRPVFSVLVGLDKHGRAGVALLIGALLSIGGVYVGLGVFEAGLLGAALGVVVPLSIVNGLYLPAFACRLLDLPLRRYLADALGRPLWCTAIFAACLIVARWTLADYPLAALGAGLLGGGGVLVWLYWLYVLPASLKAQLRSRLHIRTAPNAGEATS